MSQEDSMNSKRKRIDDSDDDELWNEAALIDEAIIRTQSSQMLATQASQHPMDPPVGFSNRGNGNDQNKITELQAKIDEVMGELVKKSREKTDLLKEISRLKSRPQMSQNVGSQCTSNCKKQIDAVTTDLRFKDSELMSLRKRVKELTKRRTISEPPRPEVPKEPPKIPLTFPTLQLNPHQDLEVLEEFLSAESADQFSRRQFSKWCNLRGDLDPDEAYMTRLSSSAPAVFQKLISSIRDDALTAAFLDFLGHIQIVHGSDSFCQVLAWEECVPSAHTNVDLMLALLKFIRKTPDPLPLFAAIKSLLAEESTRSHPQFEFLLTCILQLLASRTLTHDIEIVAKTVLRVYRHSLHCGSSPTQMNLLLIASLRLLLTGANLEGELVSVVTRAEAFHHLGDVLKKFIRWQPTASLTGCPEMMEIAENSFRHTDW